MAWALPACGLARLGDIAARPGKHMPHGSILIKAGSVPVEGHVDEVMCYESQWLDWLPVCWTELKHVHMVITDGHGQKVPFEGRTCSAKLLLRQRGSYLQIWKKGWHHHHHHHGGLHYTIHQLSVPARSWLCQHLQRAVPLGHHSAQGPWAAGQCALSWRHVPRKDH